MILLVTFIIFLITPKKTFCIKLNLRSCMNLLHINYLLAVTQIKYMKLIKLFK